jgi:hypothetical protein
MIEKHKYIEGALVMVQGGKFHRYPLSKGYSLFIGIPTRFIYNGD